METDLFIDQWSERHNKDDHLIEKFEGKVKMTNVSEQKYLGFILSEDGSKTKKIENKEKRAIGINGLGKYTVECGIIYLNSLLRSSILFAAETMYAIKEKDYRQLERIEEDLLRYIFKTERGCPIYMLYSESGHIPARFYIKRIKLIFTSTS